MFPSLSSTNDLARELGPNERLLWSGQPRQGLRLRAADAFLIPFSLLWGGFALFWESSVILGGAPLIFLLWGVPFVLVGVYITVGRFFLDAATRANTQYGVSNERVLIVTQLFSRRVRTLPLHSLQEIGLIERRDGSGTITFGAGMPFAEWYRGLPWPGMDQRMPPAFDLIPDARAVYERIRNIQRPS